MNALSARPIVHALLLTAACAGTAWAEPPADSTTELPLAAAAGASAPSARPAVEPGEPDVQHIVIDEDGTRIEELRIRGQTQRITVKPKIGPKEGYEIVTGDGSRDPSFGAYSTRGAIGKSVWHIFSF